MKLSKAVISIVYFVYCVISNYCVIVFCCLLKNYKCATTGLFSFIEALLTKGPAFLT